MTPDATDLERRVDRALNALPTPAAPPALLRRVMHAVAADAVSSIPAVFEWPLAVKVALSLLSVALIVSALLVWPVALDLARPGWQSPVMVVLRAAADVARPWIPAAIVYLAAMCAAAAAAVSLLKHVALGGASQS